MLKRFIRNATAAASPVKTSGVADTTVCVSWSSPMNAASNKRRNECSGGWPVASKITVATTNATPSETSGTTNVSQRGCSSRRSIRITSAPRRPRGRAAGVALADDRPLVHHDDAVGEGEDLVEVLADQEHTDTVRRSFAQVCVDRLDRRDVEPACRRRGHDDRRLAGELTCEH